MSDTPAPTPAPAPAPADNPTPAPVDPPVDTPPAAPVDPSPSPGMTRQDRLDEANAKYLEWARTATTDDPPDDLFAGLARTEEDFRAMAKTEPASPAATAPAPAPAPAPATSPAPAPTGT